MQPGIAIALRECFIGHFLVKRISIEQRSRERRVAQVASGGACGSRREKDHRFAVASAKARMAGLASGVCG